MISSNTSSIRTRAAAVCIACHRRKVKCDLESKTSNSCSACERRNQACHPRRTTVRSQRPIHTPPGDLNDLEPDFRILTEEAEDPRNERATAPSATESAIERTSTASGFIGEQSLMVGPTLQNTPALNPVHRRLADINAQLLTTCGALNPPNKLLLEAAKDSYLSHLRYRIPVLDSADLTPPGNSSILLQQALCLIHTVLRHPRTSLAPGAGEEYYAKVRTLLSANYETDPLVNLKTMCLLHCWNMVPPDVVSTDSSWALTGMALRYAFHMGLHKESACWKLSCPKTARRIAWYLFVSEVKQPDSAHVSFSYSAKTQDRIQTLCWNRPPMGSSSFFDLAPLQLQDFEVEDVYAHFFINFVQLLKIMEKVSDAENLKENASVHHKTFEIMQLFVSWIQQLPEQLVLFDSSHSRPFTRCIHELHILYFCGLILLCHHFGRFLGLHAASVISLTASTCAARLYEELDYRDQVTYLLSIHNWCLMVACVPQIEFRITLNQEDQESARDLRIMTAVLKQMTEKWPSAHRILNLVQNAWHPTHVWEKEHSTLSRRSSGRGGGDGMFDFSTAVPGNLQPKDLFPFPRDAIPRLETLEQCELGTQAGNLQQSGLDGNLAWIYDELNFYSFDTTMPW